MWRHRFCLFGVALSLVRGADRLVCTVSVCLMLLEWVTGLLRVSRDVSFNSVDAPSAGKASMSLESESKKAHIYKKKAIFRLSPVDSRVLFFFYPCFSFTLDCVPSPLAKIWISSAQGWAGCHMTSAGSHRDVLSRSPRTLFFWHTHMWFRQDWTRKGVGGQTNKQHPDVKTQRWSWLDKSETVYIS